MSNKPTLQSGTTTWGAINKTRCHCRHIMGQHEVWASQVVCLEPRCHGKRPEDIPTDELAVKVCWNFEEVDVDALVEDA